MNPPKFKELVHVGPQFDFAAMDEAGRVVGEGAAWLLASIKRNAAGFLLSVEMLAERLGRSEDTVRRHLRKLRDARLLVESDGRWIASWRPIPTDPQICGSHARDPLPRKEKLTPSTEQIATKNRESGPASSESARETATPKQQRLGLVNRVKQLFAPKPPAPTPKPQPRNDQHEQPTMYSDAYERSHGNADANGRPKIERDDPRRMSFDEFCQQWISNIDPTFRTGLRAREQHALEHWSRDELLEAFRATSMADRPSWRYFRAVLERIAKGETGPVDKGPKIVDFGDPEPQRRPEKKEIAGLDFIRALNEKGGES